MKIKCTCGLGLLPCPIHGWVVRTTGMVVETFELEEALEDMLFETLGHFVIKEDSDGI